MAQRDRCWAATVSSAPYVARLVAAGWNVIVPTRNRERAKHLILLPTVDVVEADIHDPLALEQLAARADAAINLVGILNERRRGDFERAHVELPRKLVAACRAVRVPRLLHMSALNAGATAPSRYLRSKGEGEAPSPIPTLSGRSSSLGDLRSGGFVPQLVCAPRALSASHRARPRADARFSRSP
jgi:nucleoside-diphosphate-sugar epimerase